MKDSPFFKDTPRKTLDMDGEPIEFPILYYDLRCINGIFTARTSKLRTLLPHPNFRPIELWPGTGMVCIGAFEYHDTSIGPYNEVAVAIPVRFPPAFSFPGIAAVSMMRANVFPVYIHHLPVTTEIALRAGVHFWNYPKFVAEITFQDRDQGLEVVLREDDELILKMSASKPPARHPSQIRMHTYSIRDKEVMHALVDGRAARQGTVMMGRVARLELGDHRISRELADLGMSEIARSGMYMEGMMTKLYDPDQRWDVDTLSPIVSPA
jgi:hypothetical protein